MRRGFLSLCLLVLIIFGLTAVPSQAQSDEGWRLHILEADAQHLLLELTLPNFQTETLTHNGVIYQRLSVDETWSRWGQPGQPQLPRYSLPIGLPWPGQPQIEVVEVERERLDGYRLYPAPALAADGTPNAPEIAEVFTLDAAAYEVDTIYPGTMFEVTDFGFIREQPLFRLNLHPFQYHPRQKQLEVYHRLRLEITFPEPPATLSAADVTAPPPAFEKLLQQTLVNYDTLPQAKAPLAPATQPPGEISGASAINAEYVIITHPNFYDAVQELKTYRQSRGLSVAVVTTDEIYATYNGGVKSPEAIRDFLKDAYPTTVFVLLVGDANAATLTNPDAPYDYLPAHYDPVVLFGDAPNDTWYAKVYGNDDYPDLLIGRISARSTSDVTTVINKIKAYEQSPPSGWWARKAILVADDGDSRFKADMDKIATYLPGSVTVTKLYGNNGDNVINDIKPGTLVVAYSGHGTSEGWGWWPGLGTIFQKSNISSMNNGGKLPFLTVANCANGYFADPDTARVLAEEFLLTANKGGIASWAPSSYSYPSVNGPMIQELYRTIFEDGDLILGSAVTGAKIRAYNNNPGLPLTLFEVFTYFGDPALELELPAQLELNGQAGPDPVTMGDTVTYSLNYTVSGADEAPNLTLLNTLPPHTVYQSASPAPSSVNGRILTWNLGDVSGSPPSQGAIQITARLETTGLAHNQQLTNKATLFDHFKGDQVVQLKTRAVDAPIDSPAITHDGPTFLGSATSFTGTTQSGTNVTYTWDFGDGSPSQSGTFVQHTYADIDTYEVQLTAANGVSSKNTSTLVKIRDIPPEASFLSSTPDKIGQVSWFQSTSTGTNLVYAWSLGDETKITSGSTSNLTHTYAMTGTYPVVLTATNSEGSSVASGTIDIISAVIAPIASFTSSSPDPLFQTTTFTNTSQDGGEEAENLSYLWDFGDGTFSTEQHPTHRYRSNGLFVLSLTISNTLASDQFSDTVTITPAPHRRFLPIIFKSDLP